jgi:galactose mutarotase-like enzyme
MPAAAFALPTVSPFGRLPDGGEAHLYTLEVPGGWKATITDFGAILTSLHVPGKDGKPVDVVLGFDSLDGYTAKHPYFGATCGRVANRIAAGRFELDGKAYTLATNNEPNHLHGGVAGFDKKLWKATPRTSPRLAITTSTVAPSLPAAIHSSRFSSVRPEPESRMARRRGMWMVFRQVWRPVATHGRGGW